jgi:hypothetical protein
MCILYHLLKATDHGHMNQLCFTHLLRKTSVIGSIKVKGQGPVAGAWRSGPLCATCFSTFFRLELFFARARGQQQENSETQSSQEKKGRRVRVDHPHQLPTDRWLNFLVIVYEPVPSSDAHDCVPYNLMIEYVSHAERARDASTLTNLSFPLPE